MDDLIYDFAAIGDALYAARLSGLYRSDDGGRNWQLAYDSLGISEPLPTLALAAAHGDLFAGVGSGVLRSADGGATWEQVFVPSPRTTVTALVASPNDVADGTVIAGTAEDGIFFSRDRGQTWQSGNFGLLDMAVFSLAALPDGIVFAGTESGVFRSTNGGHSWREVDLPVGYKTVLSLAVTAGAIYAGTEANGLLRSSDGGTTWQSVGTFSGAINRVMASGTDFLVLHDDQLLLSRDGGDTWAAWHAAETAGESITAVYAPAGFSDSAPVLLGCQGGKVLVLP
jgi:photosystem II stability/assembly factor-like uncharacterized protein